jgi:DNA repair protein RecO (recombination protein O)
MRVSLQPCYVLHSRPYRNTSKLLDVFSRDYGRCTLVARGARKNQSKNQSALLLFVPLLVSWQGGGEVQTLISVESQKHQAPISTARLLSGFYLNELLMRLLPRADAHPPLFELYEQTLTQIALNQNEESVLRNFEYHTLRELGYGLMLSHEADSGQPVAENRLYCYDMEQGPIGADTGFDNGVMVHGKTLLALLNGELVDPQVLKEAKILMRAALASHLGGKPLKSRELYIQQKQLLKTNHL